MPHSRRLRLVSSNSKISYATKPPDTRLHSMPCRMLSISSLGLSRETLTPLLLTMLELETLSPSHANVLRGIALRIIRKLRDEG